MSATIALLSERIEGMFPSLHKLYMDCWSAKPKRWGLRQHRRFPYRASFGRENRKWRLVVPVDDIFVQAELEYPRVRYKFLLVTYAIDVVTKKIVWQIIKHNVPTFKIPVSDGVTRTSLREKAN